MIVLLELEADIRNMFANALYIQFLQLDFPSGNQALNGLP